MDIVGYSRLSMSSQAGVQIGLQNIVQSTAAVRRAQERPDRLIIRPSGDGMALLFFGDPFAAVRCAVEISDTLHTHADAIKVQTGATLRLRMGINTGPVLMVEDLNRQADVAGDGIIIAQRVMDCGDAGHILLSKAAAEEIIADPEWTHRLTNLGECRVKHGVFVSLYNLHGRTIGCKTLFGNYIVPAKVRADGVARRETAQQHAILKDQMASEERRQPFVRSLLLMIIVLAMLGIIGGLWRWQSPATFQETFAHWPQTIRSYLSPSSKTSAGSAPKPRASHQTGPGVSSGPADKSPLPRRLIAREVVTRMPRLIGMSLSQAERVCAQYAVTVLRSDNPDTYSTQRPGHICLQWPKAGTPLRGRADVYVRNSLGQRPRVGQNNLVAVSTSDDAPSPVPAPLPSPVCTGILVQAEHLGGFMTSDSTAIYGSDGTQVYPPADFDPSSMDMGDYGPLRFSPSRDAARAAVGAHPLILRAVALVPQNGKINGVRLNQEDTSRLLKAIPELDPLHNHNFALLK